MDWSTVRYEQNSAYYESLFQDQLKKTKVEPVEEPDKKLSLKELREKRLQAFTQNPVKKT
jgi:hypothetical protein